MRFEYATAANVDTIIARVGRHWRTRCRRPHDLLLIATTRCAFADWACLLDDHLVMQAGESARHVYIGVAANRGTVQVLEQIERARAQGAKGFSIYSYSSVTPDMWSALTTGPFARPATVPSRPWL